MQQELTEGNASQALMEHIGCDGRELKKLVHGVMQQVQNSDNDQLRNCSIQSFVNCMKVAHDAQLPINQNGFAYLVPYKNKATFQPGYHGYIYKLKKLIKGFDCDVKFVWKDDTYKIWSEDGNDKYLYEAANPFRADYKDIIGTLIVASWVDESGVRTLVKAMPKAEIDKRENCAKSKKFWGPWYERQVKKTSIKWALSDKFKTEFEQLDALDNEGYEPERAAGEYFTGNLNNTDADKRFEEEEKAWSEGEGETIDGECERVDDIDGDNGGADSEHPDSGVVLDELETDKDVGQYDVQEDDESADIGGGGDSLHGGEAEEGQVEEGGLGVSEQQQDEVPAWDGRSVVIGERTVKRDWDNAVAAYKYLKGVMEKRKTQSSRRALADENSPLMGALVKSGKAHLIKEMSQIIIDGEPDDTGETDQPDGQDSGSQPAKAEEGTQADTEGTVQPATEDGHEPERAADKEV